MFYVYILFSLEDKMFYIGYSNNLKARIKQHHDGLVKSTKPRRPLILLYYESHKNKYDALRREGYLKTSKGKSTLKTMLRESLKEYKIF